MWERRRDWRRIVGQNKTTYTQNLWEDSNEKIIRVALGEIADWDKIAVQVINKKVVQIISRR